MATMMPQEGGERHTDKAATDRRAKNTKPKSMSSHIKARVQEKQELSYLNDRLAAYIERVQSLENQNAELSNEVNQAKDSCSRELQNIKEMYESELTETRRLLDDTSKEKALLQLENNKLNGILEDLRPKLEHEQSANRRIQGKLRDLERRLKEKENQLADNKNERSELQNRVNDMEAQIEELEAKLAKDKEQLEKEIIARIDAENRYQTLKEESQFAAQVHQNEVSQALLSAPAPHADVRSSADYEGILQEKLQELREEFLEEAEHGMQELEDAYRMKIDEMKTKNERDGVVITKSMEKQNDLSKLVETLRSDNNILSSKVETFQKRVAELERLRSQDLEEFRSQVKERDEKNRTLQEKYDALEEEYETLLGIKIALDMELSAYNKLLEGEELRLNLQAPTSKGGSFQRGSRKRGHRDSMEYSKPNVETSSSGAISFADVDANGKFVAITNTGTEAEELSGFSIRRLVDGKNGNIGFQFPSDFVLPPQQTVTVWSESEDMTANPPDEFVLEGDWSSGGKTMVTTVVNGSFEVVAKHTVTMTKTRRKTTSNESCTVM